MWTKRKKPGEKKRRSRKDCLRTGLLLLLLPESEETDTGDWRVEILEVAPLRERREQRRFENSETHP
jgi:hypothetical protein